MKLSASSYDVSSDSTSTRSVVSAPQACSTKADRSARGMSIASCSTSLTRCHSSGVIDRRACHLAEQPGPRRIPLPLDARGRKVHRLGRLLDRKPREKAQLHDAAL